MSTTIQFADVNVGDSLPEQVVELTSSLIVGGALASQDFTPVHHDLAAAKASGMQNVFMNILTTNGLVERFVTDWAGIDAQIRNVSIKLGSPNLPGDQMKMTGSISEKDANTGVVAVDVTGKNAWGNHVSGTVKLALPQ